jgi:hypothetical protein
VNNILFSMRGVGRRNMGAIAREMLRDIAIAIHQFITGISRFKYISILCENSSCILYSMVVNLGRIFELSLL